MVKYTGKEITLADQKQRIIDLFEWQLALPQADIYDEPVRYYKANVEWTPILHGLLDWLAEVAPWAEAEDESYSGIQQMLKYLVGLDESEGIIVTTVEDLEKAVCSGVKCAVADIGTALKAAENGGLLGNITVDEDGNIVFGDSIGGGSGFTASPEEVTYGQAIAIEDGINEYILKIADYVSNPNITNQRAEDFLIAQYLMNASVTDAVTEMGNFITQGTTSATQLPTIFREALYSDGFTKQVLSTLIIESDYSDVARTDVWLEAINALTQEQIDLWADEGVPSTEVFSSPSFLPPAYNFEWESALMEVERDRNFDVQPSYNSRREFRLELSGEITNGDGHIWNGVYLQDSNGIYQYNPVRLAVNPSPSPLNLVPDSQPPNVFGNATVLGYTDENTSNATRDGAYRLIAVDFNAINTFRAVTPLTGKMTFRLITIR